MRAIMSCLLAMGVSGCSNGQSGPIASAARALSQTTASFGAGGQSIAATALGADRQVWIATPGVLLRDVLSGTPPADVSSIQTSQMPVTASLLEVTPTSVSHPGGVVYAVVPETNEIWAIDGKTSQVYDKLPWLNGAPTNLVSTGNYLLVYSAGTGIIDVWGTTIQAITPSWFYGCSLIEENLVAFAADRDLPAPQVKINPRPPTNDLWWATGGSDANAGQLHKWNGLLNNPCVTEFGGTFTTLPEIPSAIAVNSQTGAVYAALPNSKTVVMYDNVDAIERGTPTGAVAVPGPPTALAVNPHGNDVIAVIESQNAAVAINGGSHSIIAPIALGQDPTAIRVATGSDFAYVANSDSITEIADPGTTADTLVVPIRICALQGSDAAQMMTVGNDMTDGTLRGYITRANNYAWATTGAHVLFQPPPIDHFPIIADQDTLDGQPVGTVNGSGLPAELTNTADACDKAWQQAAPDAKGLVVVNAQNVLAGMAFSLTVQVTPDLVLPLNGSRAAVLCDQPRMLTTNDVAHGFVIQKDLNEVTLNVGVGNPQESPFSHELGHLMMLGHGNGLDDNRDGVLPPLTGPRRYDEFCDPLALDEDNGARAVCGFGLSLMEPISQNCQFFSILQIEQARAAAAVAPNVTTNDPSCAVLRPVECLPGQCSVPAEFLLRRLDISETPSLASTIVAFTIGATDPTSFSGEYYAFVDTDDDASTGCSSASLLGATSVQGVELAFQLALSGGHTAATIWKCAGGSFTPISDSRIASRATQRLTELLQPVVSELIIQLPDDVIGNLPPRINASAVSYSPGAGTVADQIPGPGVTSDCRLRVPPLPSCMFDPYNPPAGATVTIRATGLPPSAQSTVEIDGAVLGAGTTDAAGSLQSRIQLPANLSLGIKAATVHAGGSAGAATCAINIASAPATPWTTATLQPRANLFGWNQSNVVAVLNAFNGPSGAAIEKISFSATGANPIPKTDVMSNSASAALSHEGVSVLGYFATDTAGSVEPTETLTIRIDKTQPVISASSSPAANAYGWVNQPVTVSFACSDTLSGIQTCEPPHVLATEGIDLSASGSAKDNAGNTSTAVLSNLDIDLTPPVIAYSGNLGTYTVDEQIDISCTATDALSGVLATTCANVDASAYSFPLGTNVLSAQASDRAGNSTTATTQFTVLVDFDSLCRLSEQFVGSDKGIANSMCSKLAAASAAKRRGDAPAERGLLRAYLHEVTAQAGKVITVAQSDLLIAFATTLL